MCAMTDCKIVLVRHFERESHTIVITMAAIVITIVCDFVEMIEGIIAVLVNFWKE